MKQRECYNGHKRQHAIQFQAVQAPNGLMMNLYGPASGRRHESFLMMARNLNDRLAAIQVGDPIQYTLYGDAAYGIQGHVKRGHQGESHTRAEVTQHGVVAGAYSC
jgi:hypothetical protein